MNADECVIRDDKEKGGKGTADSDRCCCYFIDPCGCFTDPCGCGGVDSCCCCC